MWSMNIQLEPLTAVVGHTAPLALLAVGLEGLIWFAVGLLVGWRLVITGLE